MLTQKYIARKWGVSKSLISRYVKRGMPLTSLIEADFWVRKYINRRAICLGNTRELYNKSLPPRTPSKEEKELSKLLAECFGESIDLPDIKL